MTFRLAAALLLCTPVLAPALAQSDPMALSRSASANQLGVLEYCQSHGYVDQGAVTAQKSVMARLPSSPNAAPTDAAEALGRQGSLSNNGNAMPLSDMATRSNTTVEALCKQMGSAVTQTAAMFGSSGMPSMPGGMPTMPNGMPAMPGGMPQMPSGMPGGMPTMPGATR